MSCQKCIRVTMVILIMFIVVQIILAIIKGVFTSNIVTAELTQKILLMVYDDPARVEKLDGEFKMAAFAFSIITIAGVMCVFFVLCSARFCGAKCKGMLPKCFIVFSAVIMLAIAIVWSLIGGALVAVRMNFNEEFVITQCQNAKEKKYDEMSVDMKVTQVDVREFFTQVVDVDKQLSETVNSFMCTDFCICPGNPTDEHYKEYEALDDAIYAENNRVFSGFDAVIDLTRFSGEAKKPMFWNYDLTTKTTDPYLETLTSESMLKCIEKIPDIADAYKLDQVKKAKVAFKAEYPQLSDSQIDQQFDSSDKKTEADQFSAQFKQMGETVNSNQIEEKYQQLIEYIENEYECSGMCSSSLFYLTQSVEKGPPKKGCLAPLVGEITSLIGNLGDAMVASAVFFFLMIICVFPVCCYAGHSDAVQAYKEGGEVELSDSKDQEKQDEERRIENANQCDKQEGVEASIDNLIKA